MTPSRRSVVALLWCCAAGCGSSGPDADRAVVELGDRSLELTVDRCGRDGATVFVFATDRGAVVQAVVGLDEVGDELVADEATTGLSVELDGAGYGAFGEEAFDAAATTGGQRRPGRILDARVDGSRIVVEAEAELLGDGIGAAGAGGEPERLVLDANCPQNEGPRS